VRAVRGRRLCGLLSDHARCAADSDGTSTGHRELDFSLVNFGELGGLRVSRHRAQSFALINYTDVFEALSLDNILLLWHAAVLERRVLIHANRLSRLHLTVELLQALIFPLVWTTPVVSMVPHQLNLADLLSAPFSMLMGVPTCQWRKLSRAEIPVDTVVVDLDRNVVTPMSPLPLLPIATLHTMKRELKALGADRHACRPHQRLPSSEGDAEWETIDINDSPASRVSIHSPTAVDGPLPVRDWAPVHRVFSVALAEVLEGLVDFLPSSETAGSQVSRDLEEEMEELPTPSVTAFDASGFCVSRGNGAEQAFTEELVRASSFLRLVETATLRATSPSLSRRASSSRVSASRRLDGLSFLVEHWQRSGASRHQHRALCTRVVLSPPPRPRSFRSSASSISLLSAAVGGSPGSSKKSVKHTDTTKVSHHPTPPRPCGWCSVFNAFAPAPRPPLPTV